MYVNFLCKCIYIHLNKLSVQVFHTGGTLKIDLIICHSDTHSVVRTSIPELVHAPGFDGFCTCCGDSFSPLHPRCRSSRLLEKGVVAHRWQKNKSEARRNCRLRRLLKCRCCSPTRLSTLAVALCISCQMHEAQPASRFW